jgi:hypothetical protein
VSTGKSHVTYTRIRAPYVNPDGFRFNIYRANVFSGLGKVLGMQDIEIGDAFFDDEFILQGTSEELVCRLLANTSVRQMIQDQPDIHFQVKDDEGWFRQAFPNGVDELYFERRGIITDKQRLKELFDLFALVLDELCRLGAAYQSDPGVTLR